MPGVGKVQLFGSEKALRIWFDPMKLHSYGLSVTDVLTAVSQQNVIVSIRRTGDEPAVSGQTVTYPITVRGQLTRLRRFAILLLNRRSPVLV